MAIKLTAASYRTEQAIHHIFAEQQWIKKDAMRFCFDSLEYFPQHVVYELLPIEENARHTDQEKERLVGEINALNSLERNWDGYGAQPISICVIKDALVFLSVFPKRLPLPQLGYTADDEILLYWVKDGDRYDLSFYGDDMIYAYRRATDSEEEHALLPFNPIIETHLHDIGI